MRGIAGSFARALGLLGTLAAAVPLAAQESVTSTAPAAANGAAVTTAPATAPASTPAAAPAADSGFSFGNNLAGAAAFFEDNGESAIDELLEEPTWDGPRFGLKGYYRLNWELLDNPDMQGPDNETGAKRVNLLQHRLRLLPSIGLNDKTTIFADAIVGEGLTRCDNGLRDYRAMPCNGIFGANGVTVLDTQLTDGFANIEIARFWGEVTTPIGQLRVGRQPSHWGLGIFSNDGLREQDFGDNHFGDTYDRIAFGTKPLGADSNLVVALVYDLIGAGTPILGQRGTPTLTDDSDNIHEGIFVALYKTAPLDLGVYQVARHQKRYPNRIFISDAYGRLDIGLLYGAFEVAWLYGASRGLPFIDQSDLSFHLGDRVEVSAWNWALEGGLRFDWYDLKLKLGNSTGDQNTLNDRPEPRVESFAFNPDYNVGLIMFEYAYANLIERKIADQFKQLDVLQGDGIVTGEQVRLLGIAADLARTDGGVSNAFYVNPVGIFRPVDELTLKLGALWAQTNDGIAVVGSGPYAQYENELGWEFDAGVMYTFRKRFAAGIDAGVMLPGAVFDQPRTVLDPVTGLNVPLAGRLNEADPMVLGLLKFQFTLD